MAGQTTFFEMMLLPLFRTTLLSLLVSVVAMACHSAAASVVQVVHHEAMVSRAGESIYVDRVSNRSVMRADSDTGSRTIFCSFLVGWQDSAADMDKDRQRGREKYFQYSMQEDWVALVDGDSLSPVFFQERPGLNQQLKEGVMVFELPLGAETDTLVYKHGYGSWGTRLFVLNLKSPYRHAQDQKSK